ncbi:hypothetical protein [Chitinimonas taiwanensis]|uniref:DUF4440 domain-containing protein n=1 Tax=Chitinimonas taiwanensis DSM 18899 TaxID=1121279 RepID=A0A1K2H958_9NEIS|nr:hypothetical protein [Chitinimonas taiwanensis]SFZ73334.1 hypothetical protein SAMN02745887_00774 [Chitinimonas taiwanensis DSM 18899]
MRTLLLALLLSPLCTYAAEATPEAAVSALWRALSHDAGADVDLPVLKRLFHADAVVFLGHYQKERLRLRRLSGIDFLKPSAPINKKGFYECEVARQLHRYDRFAVAYSVVESRSDQAASQPDFVGVNSIQLQQVGEQWQVLSLHYQVEKPGLPIPLDGGQSGRCLD